MPAFINGHWKYFSDDVPGYTEKYTRCGMRERNAKLIQLQRKAKDETMRNHYNALLVENNLPLVAKIIDSFRRSRKWTEEKSEDIFQECATNLFEEIKKMDSTIPIGYFQIRIYKQTVWHIQSILIDEERKNIKYEYFDEEEFIPDTAAPMENESVVMLLDELMDCLTWREKDILHLYYYGNVEKYIEPMNLEAIAENFGLTRETIRTIKEKAIKKLKKYINYLLNKSGCIITREDFILKENS